MYKSPKPVPRQTSSQESMPTPSPRRSLISNPETPPKPEKEKAQEWGPDMDRFWSDLSSIAGKLSKVLETMETQPTLRKETKDRIILTIRKTREKMKTMETIGEDIRSYIEQQEITFGALERDVKELRKEKQIMEKIEEMMTMQNKMNKQMENIETNTDILIENRTKIIDKIEQTEDKITAEVIDMGRRIGERIEDSGNDIKQEITKKGTKTTERHEHPTIQINNKEIINKIEETEKYLNERITHAREETIKEVKEKTKGIKEQLVENIKNNNKEIKKDIEENIKKIEDEIKRTPQKNTSLSSEETLQTYAKITKNKNLMRQNPEIYKEEEHKKMKLKYRKKSTNQDRCHAVLQVHPEVWRKITEQGRLYMGMERLKVEDQSPLIQCTRCLGFGHGRKFCVESADRCSHCGGPHLRANCPDREAGNPPRCCNCAHAEYPDQQHNAFSTECRTREKWEYLVRSTTQYI
ncbi:unnamed protein product [Diatraea saccharalis]|uniref:Uncharacterized protein n=1 Tax=Diatraea saccharalis TaxID=40085 RepID=A0A9N9R0G0_9NEOP|nr:unnamed protein product [Diatraea saccharalis]